LLAWLIYITSLYSLEPGGPHRFWYQSRTVCRKPLLLVVVESSVYENYLKAKSELQNVGKVSFYSLSLSILVLNFLILSCWFRKGFSTSFCHSKFRSLVGMSFLNQLTYIVFLILWAKTRRCNQKIFFPSWSLCFESFTSFYSRLQGFLSPCLPPSICLNTSKSIPCSGIYLMITTCGILWVAQLVVIPFFVF
jgi:hypothetical protein